MSRPATLPYGSWPSPISAADVASGTLSLEFPGIVADPPTPAAAPRSGGSKGRPAGRWTLRAGPPGSRRNSQRCARPGVERSQPDHRVRRPPVDPRPGRARSSASGTTSASTCCPTEPRPATPHDSPDRRHHAHVRRATSWPCRNGPRGARDARRRRRRAVRWCMVPLDGSAADDDEQRHASSTTSTTSTHIHASPPTARRVSYIAWDHPQMPWDGTVAAVVDLGNRASGVRAGATGIGD